jgi:hypothetical protein
VRGAYALRPNVWGLSHRIRVRSLVGRFLEHTRIFYFENGGVPDVYLGSADWMPRNLYERVEVMFPINDCCLRQRLFGEILQNYLRDSDKTRFLRPDGSYERAYKVNASRLSRNGHRFSAQGFFVALAEGRSGTEPADVTEPNSAGWAARGDRLKTLPPKRKEVFQEWEGLTRPPVRTVSSASRIFLWRRIRSCSNCKTSVLRS